MATVVRELNLLTVRETAELLRQSERSVRRKIHNGQIPAVRLGDHAAALRVRADRLEQWLDDHQASSSVSDDGFPAGSSFAGADPVERRESQNSGQSSSLAHAGQDE